MGYQYAPLGLPLGIRILTVDGSADKDAGIECTLREVSLQSSPEYFALSYTWGGQRRDRPISCNGKTLLITPNCEAALRCLRPDDPLRVLPIWVDMICINQSSTSERGVQVAIMDKIFKQAQIVHVWLGESTPQSERFFRYHHRLEAIIASLGARYAQYFVPAVALIPDWITSSVFLPRLYEDDIKDIALRPYWTRMWTLQEFSLSNLVSLHCGSSEPITVLSVIEGIHLNSAKRYGDRGERILRYLKLWQQRNNTSSGGAGFGREIPGVSALHLGRAMQATDPEDKVFALRSLFPDVLEAVPTDYNQPLKDIYIAATKATIQHEKSLMVLKLVQPSRSVSGLPSWVPNLTYTDPMFLFIKPYPDQRWNSCKGSLPAFSFSSSPPRLFLKGYHLDTVDVCSRVLPKSSQRDCKLKDNHDSVYAMNLVLYRNKDDLVGTLRHCVRVVHNRSPHLTFPEIVQKLLAVFELAWFPPKRQYIEEFFRVIMTGYLDFGFATNELESVAAYIERRHAPTYQWHREEFWAPEPRPPTAELLVPNTWEGKIKMAIVTQTELAAIFLQLYRVLEDTCFIATRDGRIGLADASVEIEDRVYLFCGADAPYMVRSGLTGNFLMGHALIPDIMFGEAWPNDEDLLQQVVIS